MHRIDVPSATPDNEFTEGSPTGGVPATVVSASWLNDIQEELISILVAAGIVPVKGVQDQVIAAIRSVATAQFIAQFTGANQLKAANGFQKLPGGFILQAGVSNGTTTEVGVTFPVAFPNLVMYVGTSDRVMSGTTVRAMFSVGNVLLGGFTVIAIGSLVRGSPSLAAPGLYGCPWFAIGY
jgi:hypothetical protein